MTPHSDRPTPLSPPPRRYTYETAPAALKAHLAETTGSIVVCRTGTLFMIQ